MEGIILRNGLKEEIIEVTSGELAVTTDTNEISNKNLKYRPIIVEEFPEIFMVTSTPSFAGVSGDHAINTTVGEHIEYFKKDVWEIRYEGYSEEHMFNNFELRLNADTSGFIRRDGTIQFDVGFDNGSDNSFMSKADADLLAPGINSIKTDGTSEMQAEYIPLLGQDVIDLKFLGSGTFIVIPPEIDPEISGVLWNNKGIPVMSAGPTSIVYDLTEEIPLTWTIVPLDGRPVGMVQSGVYGLTSENYPSNYPDRVWTYIDIQGSLPNSHFEFTFDDVVLENPYDHIVVNEGFNDEVGLRIAEFGWLAGDYTGIQPNIVSTSNQIRILFSSDTSTGMKGFALRYITEINDDI